MLPTSVLLILLATASVPCQYGWTACDDYSKPLDFVTVTDNATDPPTYVTLKLCTGDGSLWPRPGFDVPALHNPPDDPAVLAWRCPASTFPSRYRYSTAAAAVPAHIRHTKD